jgi:hypothetical protein
VRRLRRQRTRKCSCIHGGGCVDTIVLIDRGILVEMCTVSLN